MKIESNNDNKKITITLIALGIIISFFGGSLAYWSWQSSEEEKTLVSVSVQGATLTIEGGNVEKTGMYPTNDCAGAGAMIGEVATATAVNGTATDMEVSLKIRATLSVSQGSLTTEKKGKINWALVDTSAGTTCSTTTYKGTLADVTTNTDIDTGIRFTATANSTTTKSYRIYVWLDSSYTHTNSGNTISDPMQNLSISVKFSEASELSQEIVTKTAGLYGTNGEFTSWEELLNNGIVNVTDGVLTTGAYYNDDDVEYYNSSAAVLVGELVIPEGVTSLGERAFYACSGLTSVVIPDGVTSIGYMAFGGCNNLISVVIPDSVTSIGDYAFVFCESLTSVVIPDGVTSIAENTFAYCSSLTSIVIPNSVTFIGNNAFRDCSSLTSVVIPDGVTSIENWTFADCISLTSIVIPDGVTSIGEYAFYNCSNLSVVNFTGTSTQWENINIGENNSYLINSTINFNYGTPLISFTIDYIGNFNAVDGMTWEEWVNSDYNPGQYTLSDYNVTGGSFYVTYNFDRVEHTDVIIANAVYGIDEF